MSVVQGSGGKPRGCGTRSRGGEGCEVEHVSDMRRKREHAPKTARIEWTPLRIVHASPAMNIELREMVDVLTAAGVAHYRSHGRTQSGAKLTQILVHKEDYDRAYEVAFDWLPPKPRSADV